MFGSKEPAGARWSGGAGPDRPGRRARSDRPAVLAVDGAGRGYADRRGGSAAPGSLVRRGAGAGAAVGGGLPAGRAPRPDRLESHQGEVLVVSCDQI